MKVVFFGTSSFAARTLKYLIDHKIDVCAIVTRPDRPKGRSLHLALPPVKETALSIAPHIPIHQPEKASTPEFEAILRSYQADLFVVVAYGEIIKQHILDLPKLDCINIHASLLPKYRGAAPIQRALMDGVSETGMTIIQMTSKMDAGDILAIQSLPVPDEMTFGELEPALCQLGCELVRRVIHDYEVGSVTRIPQDPAQATLAAKLMPQDEEIDWKRSASAVHNQIRALSPFPSAWFKIKLGEEEKRVKIKKSLVAPADNAHPGQVLRLDKDGWVVACGHGALQLLEVQMEGKKVMSAVDFIKGLHRALSILIK
jgi:methionyl-tRNA formyltransferase